MAGLCVYVLAAGDHSELGLSGCLLLNTFKEEKQSLRSFSGYLI